MYAACVDGSGPSTGPQTSYARTAWSAWHALGQFGLRGDAAARAVAAMQLALVNDRFDLRRFPDLMASRRRGVGLEFATTSAARVGMDCGDRGAGFAGAQVLADAACAGKPPTAGEPAAPAEEALDDNRPATKQRGPGVRLPCAHSDRLACVYCLTASCGRAWHEDVRCWEAAKSCAA